LFASSCTSCVFFISISCPAALKLMQTSCLSVHRGLMTRI
jgi:hypothetical protein